MQQINVNELIPHPRNNEFFDDIADEKWNEFLESVRTRGVIEPIVITTDKMIVSGHQRVRACKELGIDTVLCEIRSYHSEDEILQDLLETNIRQRGDVGGSAQKVGRRIKELERLYGIQHGGDHGNQYKVASGQIVNLADQPTNDIRTQEELASQLGITVKSLHRYKALADMIPELSSLVDGGTITPNTALAIMRQLTPEEQEQMIASLDVTEKITQKEVQAHIDRVKQEYNKDLQDRNATVNALQQERSRLLNELDYTKSQLNHAKEIAKASDEVRQATQKEIDLMNKTKEEIQDLTLQKENLRHQINHVTDLTDLSVKVQQMLENDLAPVKFKKCLDYLQDNDYIKENFHALVDRVRTWVDEMSAIDDGNYVDADVVEIQ